MAEKGTAGVHPGTGTFGEGRFGPPRGRQETAPAACYHPSPHIMRLPEIERNSGLRLSRDKLNKLAHSVTDALAALETVKFVEDHNTIRLEVRRILEEVLKAEARIDAAARQKIESQKRTILEGTQEWDILYRKYYNEEVKKLGI